MNFENVIGQNHIKKHIEACFTNNRMPHAQLFVGENGYGTLAMAIACANLILNSSKESKQYSSVLQHPDFHVTVPVNTTKAVPKNPTTDDFLKDWIELLSETPYTDIEAWYNKIGIQNKKGAINKDESEKIYEKLSLKSHSGIGKVMVIWCAEKMNTTASNKLLKLIEEPPQNTFFILTTDQEELLLDTIKSRCQVLHFPRLSQNLIAENLSEKLNISSSQANFFAQQAEGNFSKALSLAQNNDEEVEFEKLFIAWVRLAFQAKKSKQIVQKLLEWGSGVSDFTRDKQIRFLKYCLHFFRQALLHNYKTNQLVFLQTKTAFSLDKFSPFIHGNNIEDIYETIQEAIQQVNRNINSKLIFTDISFKLTRYIHRK